jgi:hypothetical protein
LARKTISKDASDNAAAPEEGASQKPVAQRDARDASPAPSLPEHGPVTEAATPEEAQVSEQTDSAQPENAAQAMAETGADETGPGETGPGDAGPGETGPDAEAQASASPPPEETPPDSRMDAQPSDAQAAAGPVAPRDAEASGSHATQSQATQSQAPRQTPPPASSAPGAKPAILPLILGGVLAGGLGYGAHYLSSGSTTAAPELDAMRSEIAALRAALPVTAPLEAELAELRAQLAEGGTPELSPGDLDALAAQLRAEFAQPETPADMQPLQAALAATQSRMDALEADLAELRDLAERRVAQAEAAIDAAVAAAGLDSLRAALETGAPFPAAVTRLRDAGIDVPDVFAASAAGGIATMDTLQEGFADAARAALRVALQDAPAETPVDRLGNFLRAQIGARSTTPREGDDPDAVLSRAGAAMERSDLDAALSEIAALPDPAKAAMGDWLARAQTRSAALAALPDLATAITPE